MRMTANNTHGEEQTDTKLFQQLQLNQKILAFILQGV